MGRLGSCHNVVALCVSFYLVTGQFYPAVSRTCDIDVKLAKKATPAGGSLNMSCSSLIGLLVCCHKPSGKSNKWRCCAF